MVENEKGFARLKTVASFGPQVPTGWATLLVALQLALQFIEDEEIDSAHEFLTQILGMLTPETFWSAYGDAREEKSSSHAARLAVELLDDVLKGIEIPALGVEK